MAAHLSLYPRDDEMGHETVQTSGDQKYELEKADYEDSE